MTLAMRDDEQAIATWNDLYDPNDVEAIWGDVPAAFVTEEAAALWRADAARDILVVPSGDGRNVRPLLAEFPGLLCTDTSKQALERLRRIMARQGRPQPKTAISDVYKPKELGLDFDSILCWDLLSHLDEPRVALDALLGCLRPGGSLIANFFADDDPSIIDERSAEIGPKRYRNDHGICYQLYSAQDAASLAAGLDVAQRDLRAIEWREEPHPGYREYVHLHRGHAMILRAGA